MLMQIRFLDPLLAPQQPYPSADSHTQIWAVDDVEGKLQTAFPFQGPQFTFNIYETNCLHMDLGPSR